MATIERLCVRVIAGAGACVALVLPSVTWAQTFHARDPAHDVVAVWLNQPNAKAPANKTADITSTTFRHTSTRVTARITLRRYRAGWDWDERIRTPRASYDVSGWKTLPSSRVHMYLFRGSAQHTVSCPGVSTTIHPRRRTILVSVPTACLHHPRWVRGSVVYTMHSRAGEAYGFVYIDDGLARGLPDVEARTPRLRVG